MQELRLCTMEKCHVFRCPVVTIRWSQITPVISFFIYFKLHLRYNCCTHLLICPCPNLNSVILILRGLLWVGTSEEYRGVRRPGQMSCAKKLIVLGTICLGSNDGHITLTCMHSHFLKGHLVGERFFRRQNKINKWYPPKVSFFRKTAVNCSTLQ